MSDLATHLSGFLRVHLPAERNASQHTCDSYAYSFRLLLKFAAGRLKCKPSQLILGQIDASMVMAFLEHIEGERGNSARTRNARLAAIKSFFRYLEYRLPAYPDQPRHIHSIPIKKTHQHLID
jgi:site-specific recombinase XerD